MLIKQIAAKKVQLALFLPASEFMLNQHSLHHRNGAHITIKETRITIGPQG
jgi:hypothetical protein